MTLLGNFCKGSGCGVRGFILDHCFVYFFALPEKHFAQHNQAIDQLRFSKALQYVYILLNNLMKNLRQFMKAVSAP